MNKLLCVVSCPIDTYSGYGSRSRDFVRALIDVKGDEWDIRIASQRWGNTPWGFIDDNEDDWGFLNDFILKEALQKQIDVWVQITVPNEFQPMGKYSIGVTAGIETTVCDPSWIEGCNRMNLILASSNHAKGVFENSKFEKRHKQTNQVAGMIELTTPVEVLFEGVDTEVFRKTSQISDIKLKEVKNNFNFLYVGHWLQGDLGQDRKNTGMLVKTFLETFKIKQMHLDLL